MAYTAVSFVYGEVLTSTKMNLLSANDASFNDGTGIGAGVISGSALAPGAISSSTLASGAVTTDKLANGAVTSDKLDSLVKWSYTKQVTIAMHSSGGNDTFSIDITSLPVGAKVYVSFDGYYYFNANKEGHVKITYAGADFTQKRWMNNRASTACSIQFSISAIITKTSGNNTIGCFGDVTSSAAASYATVSAFRIA